MSEPINTETRVALASLLEEALPPAEQAALEARMQNEPAVCDEYVALLRQEVLLGELAAELRYSLQSEPDRVVKTPSIFTSKKLWAGAACVALVLLGWLTLRESQSSQETAALVLLTGEAQIERAGTVLAAREGMAIQPGDGLRVGALGRAEVRFVDGTRISTDKGANWMWTSANGGQRAISLESGALSALVEKQSNGTSYVLNTAQARVTVIGTRFRLSAENLETSIELYEGSVQFQRKVDAKEILVSAGNKATASTDKTQRFVARPMKTHDGTGPSMVWKALLVTAEPLPFYAHDVAIVQALKNSGIYLIDLKTYDHVTASDTEGMDLVVVSSHKCANTKTLRDVRVPVIAWHNIWHQDLGLMSYDATVDHQLKLRTVKWGRGRPENFASLAGTRDQFELNVYSSLLVTRDSISVLQLSQERSPLVLFPKGPTDTAGPRVAFSIDIREGAGKGAPVEIGEELFAATVRWCLAQKDATK